MCAFYLLWVVLCGAFTGFPRLMITPCLVTHILWPQFSTVCGFHHCLLYCMHWKLSHCIKLQLQWVAKYLCKVVYSKQYCIAFVYFIVFCNHIYIFSTHNSYYIFNPIYLSHHAFLSSKKLHLPLQAFAYYVGM